MKIGEVWSPDGRRGRRTAGAGEGEVQTGSYNPVRVCAGTGDPVRNGSGACTTRAP